MIEQRWGLPPLTVRDRTANDLGGELPPARPSAAPAYDVPAGPFGGACPAPPPVATTTRAARPERLGVGAGPGARARGGLAGLSAARRERRRRGSQSAL